MKKIRIIITDDHSLYRAGVRKTLAVYDDIECIAEADHGQDLLDKLECLRPDIIITGIQMPLMDGRQLVPVLKKQYPAIKIIMLTMMGDASLIKQMITLGANAYLTKTSDAAIIYDAIIACSKSWLYMNDTLRDALIKERPGYPETRSDYNFTELQIMEWYSRDIAVADIAARLNLIKRTVTAVIDKVLFKAKTTSPVTLAKFAEKRELF
jgi:DNA-binding NarL/FixJ family response regulator